MNLSFETLPKIDYQKELIRAAKQMILIHRQATLVKLILRTIVRILRLEHASLILYDEHRQVYVAYVSSGITGLKIPSGLTKIPKDNPLIRYFNSNFSHKEYLTFNDIANLQEPIYKEIRFQFFLYNAKACIPGFFHNNLLLILFLGLILRCGYGNSECPAF